MPFTVAQPDASVVRGYAEYRAIHGGTQVTGANSSVTAGSAIDGYRSEVLRLCGNFHNMQVTFGHALSQTLGATGFTCTSTSCYSQGSPATHTLFMQLQELLNRFSNATGFVPIAVDGKIGVGTVDATRRVLLYIAKSKGAFSANTAGVAGGLIAIATTKETLAAGAASVVNLLGTAASEGRLPAVQPAPPPPPLPATSESASFDIYAPTKKRVQWPYVVVGGVLTFVALYLGFHFVTRSMSPRVAAEE